MGSASEGGSSAATGPLDDSGDGDDRVLALDGDGDYVELSDSLLPGPVESFTVALWFYVEWQPEDQRELLHNGPYQELECGIEQLDVAEEFTVFCGVKMDDDWHWGRTTYELETWTFLAMTYDAQTEHLRIFKDGEVFHSESLAGRVPHEHDRGSIGARVNPPRWFFPGRLDELSIWDAALTETELNALAAGQLAPSPEASWLAYWPFDGSADDLSVYANHGALRGDAHFEDR